MEFSELDQIDVITKPKIDPRQEFVYCVYCSSRMKLLNTTDTQWLCETCGCIAKEGLGDTPNKDAGLTALATPNNPFPTDIDTLTRAVMKEVPMPDEIEEIDTRLYERDKRTGRMWHLRQSLKVLDVQDANKLI